MKTHSRKRYTLVAVIVSIAMIFSVMPSVGYAANDEQSDEKTPELETLTTSTQLSTSNVRLEEYMVKAASGAIPKRGSRGNKLDDINRPIYDELKRQIESVASGSQDNTIFDVKAELFMSKDVEYTAGELGISNGLYEKDEKGNVKLDEYNQPVLTDEAIQAIAKKWE